MSSPKFPKVFRQGQTRTTLYKTPVRNSDAFTVVWYEGHTRKRKMFADLGAAELHAQAKVNQLSRGEARVVSLSGEELLAFNRATEAIKEFAVSLDSAAVEYRDAKRLIRGASLVEAARYYAAQRLLDLPRKTVGEVYEELIQAKQDEGCSERYVADLRSRLGRFAQAFPKLVSAVTGAEIRAWLQGLDRETSKTDRRAPRRAVSNRTRNNFRLCIQTLFLFAKAQRYLPPDWDELASVPQWKVKGEAVEIFTPEEMTHLLALAPAKLVPYLVLGGFAGLRTAEIERLDWSKVDVTGGYITVDASIAKTNSRRLVPIAPNLKAWLAGCRKERGPVLELANVVNAIERLARAVREADGAQGMPAAAFRWKHNALRHSFCSYRLAEVKNAAQVSLEAGNSPQMIFQHYRELVTEQAAAEWFGITPESAAAERELMEVARTAKMVAFPARAVA